jgi:G3E family GTPase
MSSIKNVPTNVITGFLGVGKSTAIMHLLKSKPANERWAVLVNEFGEVGIDGSIFSGNAGEEQGVYIREVPGGCMCCTTGVPMQIALNMLLAKAKPDRLLIEPTGLGHPKEVLSTLNSSHYKGVLDIQRTITLVDARKIKETRYTEHPVFQQQLEIADTIVANKADLYEAGELDDLGDYVHGLFPDKSMELFSVTQGKLSLEWLEGKSNYSLCDTHHHHHDHETKLVEEPAPLGEIQFPDKGFITIKNQGEGFFSQGWIFKPEIIFNKVRLYDLLVSTDIERLKAVFIADEGVVAFNKVDGVLTELMLDETMDSRIELIADKEEHLSNFENEILKCKA